MDIKPNRRNKAAVLIFSSVYVEGALSLSQSHAYVGVSVSLPNTTDSVSLQYGPHRHLCS